jgi:ATP/maltotriose-dependent transcriptional regulator MalT
LALARAADDAEQLVVALWINADIMRFEGDDSGAERAYRDTLVLADRLEDDSTRNQCYGALAELAFKRGDLHEAIALNDLALECALRPQDRTGIVASLMNKAGLSIAAGRYAEARTAALEGLTYAGGERQSPLGAAVAIQHLADAASARGGDVQRAARLLGFVDHTYVRLGQRREPLEERLRAVMLARLQAATPAETVAALLAQGTEMSYAEALSLALKI